MTNEGKSLARQALEQEIARVTARVIDEIGAGLEEIRKEIRSCREELSGIGRHSGLSETFDCARRSPAFYNRNNWPSPGREDVASSETWLDRLDDCLDGPHHRPPEERVYRPGRIRKQLTGAGLRTFGRKIE